jgi:hypothetical protein
VIGFWQNLKTAAFAHRWLALTSLCFMMLIGAECFLAGVPAREYPHAVDDMMDIWTIFLVFTCLMVPLTFLCGFSKAIWDATVEDVSIFKLFGARVRGYFRDGRFARGLVGLALLLLMLFLVGPQKSLIQYINPYSWDPLFAAWDKALHFGHDPFRLLLPLIEMGGVALSAAIAAFYMSWFFVLAGTCFYALFLDKSAERPMRFLWTYVASWISLGWLGALLFSSVGPLYFHDFYPDLPDPYQPLIEHLKTTLEGQAFVYFDITKRLLLWARNDYMLDTNALSAMPSMHVGIAWLMFLYWRGVNRFASLLSAMYFAVMMVGSIYLGFHYAIDGYVAVAGVTLIWWAIPRLRPSKMQG